MMHEPARGTKSGFLRWIAMNAACIVSSDRDPAPPPSILVVEDEVLVRSVVGMYLRDCGFQVIEAGTADEAIRVLESGLAVDLVFSDINMPGSLDGYGLAQWLRHERPGLHVILTSGSPQRTDELGKHRPLLAKPYDHAELERLIRAMLSE
jgi:two-component system, response regulator PdtaR